MDEKYMVRDEYYCGDTGLDCVTTMLEHLSVYVVKWSVITTIPENEIWILLLAGCVVAAIAAAAVIVIPLMLLKWLMYMPHTEHCHQCAVYERRQWSRTTKRMRRDIWRLCAKARRGLKRLWEKVRR